MEDAVGLSARLLRLHHQHAPPHALLGIAPTATVDEGRATFRRLSLYLHPDRNPDPTAQQAFLILNDAMQTFERDKERGIMAATTTTVAPMPAYDPWTRWGGSHVPTCTTGVAGSMHVPPTAATVDATRFQAAKDAWGARRVAPVVIIADAPPILAEPVLRPNPADYSRSRSKSPLLDDAAAPLIASLSHSLPLSGNGGSGGGGGMHAPPTTTATTLPYPLHPLNHNPTTKLDAKSRWARPNAPIAPIRTLHADEQEALLVERLAQAPIATHPRPKRTRHETGLRRRRRGGKRKRVANQLNDAMQAKDELEDLDDDDEQEQEESDDDHDSIEEWIQREEDVEEGEDDDPDEFIGWAEDVVPKKRRERREAKEEAPPPPPPPPLPPPLPPSPPPASRRRAPRTRQVRLEGITLAPPPQPQPPPRPPPPAEDVLAAMREQLLAEERADAVGMARAHVRSVQTSIIQQWAQKKRSGGGGGKRSKRG